MKKVIEIEGRKIEITAWSIPTRFGALWLAENNYGEPRTSPKAFRDPKEALRDEENSLREMFA